MPNSPMRFYYGHGEEIDPAVGVQLEICANRHPLEVKVTDEGIGAYEFWGAPGFDSRLALEVFSDDLQIYIDFPNCTYDVALQRMEEVTGYVSERREASASEGHSDLSGTLLLKLESAELNVNLFSKEKLLNGATLTYAWEEV